MGGQGDRVALRISAVVPLMAIVRARIATQSPVPVRVLTSSRSWADVIYRAELEAMHREQGGIDVVQTLTRTQPTGWSGFDRRVDRAMVEEAMGAARSMGAQAQGPVETVAVFKLPAAYSQALQTTAGAGDADPPTGGRPDPPGSQRTPRLADASH